MSMSVRYSPYDEGSWWVGESVGPAERAEDLGVGVGGGPTYKGGAIALKQVMITCAYSPFPVLLSRAPSSEADGGGL